MVNETCTPGGTHHLVVGSAGHVLTARAVDAHKVAWVDNYLQTYGYTRFSVGGGRLSMEFMASADGQVLDTMDLTSRQWSCPPPSA